MSAPTKKPRNRKPKPKPVRKPHVAAKVPPIHQHEAIFTQGSSLTAAADASSGPLKTATYIPPMKTALTSLGSAITSAKGGDDGAQAKLVASAQKTHDLIIQHASWVQGVANEMLPEDAIVFIAQAGFAQAKVGQRPTLTAPKVTNTTVHGVVRFEMPPTPGAVMHFCEICTDGKSWERSVDTEHVKAEITGLTPGVLYYFRLRTFVRGSGYTSWWEDKLLVT